MLGASGRTLPDPVEYDPKQPFTIVQLIEKVKALYAENQLLRQMGLGSDPSENEQLKEEIKRLKNEAVDMDVILENLDSANAKVFELRERLDNTQASQSELLEALGVECNSEILTVFADQRLQIEELKKQLEEKAQQVTALEKENSELRRNLEHTEELVDNRGSESDSLEMFNKSAEWDDQKAKTVKLKRHSLMDTEYGIPDVSATPLSPMSKSVQPFNRDDSRSDTESLLSETKLEEQHLKETLAMKAEIRKLSSQILDLANAKHNEQILRGFVQRFVALFTKIIDVFVSQSGEAIEEQIARVEEIQSYLPCVIGQFEGRIENLRVDLEVCRETTEELIENVHLVIEDAKRQCKLILPSYCGSPRRLRRPSPSHRAIAQRVRQEMREIEKRQELWSESP